MTRGVNLHLFSAYVRDAYPDWRFEFDSPRHAYLLSKLGFEIRITEESVTNDLGDALSSLDSWVSTHNLSILEQERLRADTPSPPVVNIVYGGSPSATRHFFGASASAERGAAQFDFPTSPPPPPSFPPVSGRRLRLRREDDAPDRAEGQPGGAPLVPGHDDRPGSDQPDSASLQGPSD